MKQWLFQEFKIEKCFVFRHFYLKVVEVSFKNAPWAKIVLTHFYFSQCKIVEEVNDDRKNVEFVKIEGETIVVSGVAVMIVVDNTYEIVEADYEEKHVEFMKTEDETTVVSWVPVL